MPFVVYAKHGVFLAGDLKNAYKLSLSYNWTRRRIAPTPENPVIPRVYGSSVGFGERIVPAAFALSRFQKINKVACNKPAICYTNPIPVN
jgi:hypothetical protein